jgi:enterochelin esterase-like enzyme
MIIRDPSISSPEFEVENLRYLTVQSSYLKGRGDITVFVPPGFEGRTDLPICILLHGVYSSHWAWTRHMNVHNDTLKMIENGEIQPLVLVMPSDGLKGGGSGYAPQADFDFEKWIAEDVIKAVKSTIPQVSQSAYHFITGLSMGGYGALKIGSKYPNQFKAFSGHSSITDLKDLQLFINDGPEVSSPEEEKSLAIIDIMLKHKADLRPFRFDCGREDELIQSNRELHQLLVESEIPHGYDEYPGAHSADYWREHIRKSLLFFNNQLPTFRS